MPRPRLPRSGRARLGAFLACLAVLAGALDAHAAREGFETGLFWRVSRDGIPDSHVFGTIHVPDPRVAAIPDDVNEALSRSRVLATELVMRVVGDHLGDAELLEPPQRLQPLVGDAAYATLAAALAGRDVDAATLARMKPWAALLRLQSTAQTEGATLDENLYVLARSRRLPVRTLESADEQLCAFDAIPMDAQVAVLRHALAQPAATDATERAVRAYLAGDLAALAALPPAVRANAALARHYRAFTRHLIDDRTVVMHHGLFVPLRAGGVFVAVGASHLYGPKGLLAMLREDGYRVTRLR